MTIIPKGETHGWAFAKFGEEKGDRLVVSEDLVVLTKEEHDSLLRIAQSAHPMCDALKTVRKALVAPCISPHKELVALIDKAISGDDSESSVAGMTFGMAIEAMKRGKKVARRGWNGKGMWLCVPLCDGPKEIPADGIWGKPNAEYAEQNGGTVKVVPYVTMKAADGTIVMGWLASQTDMLSEDWMIVK